MSGGSYDYICYKLNDFAERIRLEDNPKRIAFAKLMKLVSEAAHDIEWVDSCDSSPGSENRAIDNVLSFLEASPDVLAKAAAFDNLKEVLKRYFNES